MAISLDNASPTGQLTVTATYSNTKTSDVTLSSSYSIARIRAIPSPVQLPRVRSAPITPAW